MTDFHSLGLAEPILRALADEKYACPTPIQSKAIPVVMAGTDLLGIAQTGTGKTAAFALPVLHHLATRRKPAARRGCRVLVLSPTRELSQQIAVSFRTYGRHLGPSVAVVVGGVSMRQQIRALARGVDVLVATPGRLIDHIEEGTVDLSGTEVLILDEADQMFDLGFIKPIRKIVAELSSRRQTLLFSATMPNEVARLAADVMRDPTRIAVTPVASTVDKIAQRVVSVDASAKRSELAKILAAEDVARALVFTRTKRGADRVAQALEGAGISAVALHGNKSQSQRERALADFRSGRARVLVATDIASRGIDVDGVTHVVNFELPEVPEAYVHRIGRTARAGASGVAISLCDPAESHLLRAIEKLTKQSIPRIPSLTPRSAVEAAPADHRAGGRAHAPHHRASASRPEHAHNGGHRQGEHGRNGRGGANDRAPWRNHSGAPVNGRRGGDGRNRRPQPGRAAG